MSKRSNQVDVQAEVREILSNPAPSPRSPEEEAGAEARPTNAQPPPAGAKPEPKPIANLIDTSAAIERHLAENEQIIGGRVVTVERIPLAELIPSPTNPRKSFSQAFTQALAANIRQQGLIEPIIVRPLRSMSVEYEDGTTIDIPPSSRESCQRQLTEIGMSQQSESTVSIDDDCGHEIVAGEQRYRAHNVLHVDFDLPEFGSIACIVRDLTDDRVREIQLSENLQREDLSPADLANSYRELVEIERARGTKGAVQTVAERLGVSKSVIDQALQMLKAVPEVLDAVRRGFISKNHAADASRLPAEGQIAYLCECLLGYADSEGELRELLLAGELDEVPAGVRQMRRWIDRKYPSENPEDTQPALFGGDAPAAGSEANPEAISEDAIGEAAGIMGSGENHFCEYCGFGKPNDELPHCGRAACSRAYESERSAPVEVRSIKLSGYVQIDRKLEAEFVTAIQLGQIGWTQEAGLLKVPASNGDVLTFGGTDGNFELSSHETGGEFYVGTGMSKTAVSDAVRSLFAPESIQETTLPVRPGQTNLQKALDQAERERKARALDESIREEDRKIIRAALKKILTASHSAAKRAGLMLITADLRRVAEAMFDLLPGEQREALASLLRWEVQPYKSVISEYYRNLNQLADSHLPQFLITCALMADIERASIPARSSLFRGFEGQYKLDIAAIRAEVAAGGELKPKGKKTRKPSAAALRTGGRTPDAKKAVAKALKVKSKPGPKPKASKTAKPVKAKAVAKGKKGRAA